MDINIVIGTVGLILAYVSVDYARKAFRKDHIEKPSEEKQHLLAQFKTNQTLSRQTYDVLYKFSVYYDAFDKEVWPGQGILYATILDEIKKSHEEGNLSDNQYADLKQRDISSITIQSHIKSLEQQFEALNLIYQEFRLKTQNI